MIGKRLLLVLAMVALVGAVSPLSAFARDLVGTWNFQLSGACYSQATGHYFPAFTGSFNITTQNGNAFGGNLHVDDNPEASACKISGVVDSDTNRIVFVACSLIVEATLLDDTMKVMFKSIGLSKSDDQCVVQGTASRQ